MATSTQDPGPKDAQSFFGLLTRGAAGVGLVLVVLPSLALFFGMDYLERLRLVGLPLLAIFGIMILFGTLALVAMLFQSLGLADQSKPLALPEGSIRSAIALSLIVLFAIISIMLFQGMTGSPLRLEGLNLTQHAEVAVKFGPAVQLIERSCVPAVAAGAACPEGSLRFAMVVQSGPPAQQVDLAKQLLILVGTLMTSVTSFYFASRDALAQKDKPEPTGATAGAATLPAAAQAEAHAEGCDVAITDPTADQDLPAARGGVAQGD
jgi:hypothetical protein